MTPVYGIDNVKLTDQDETWAEEIGAFGDAYMHGCIDQVTGRVTKGQETAAIGNYENFLKLLTRKLTGPLDTFFGDNDLDGGILAAREALFDDMQVRTTYDGGDVLDDAVASGSYSSLDNWRRNMGLPEELNKCPELMVYMLQASGTIPKTVDAMVRVIRDVYARTPREVPLEDI
ncbi:MAG TPA: hypothetical protein ENN30_02630 [Candidatus Woesearchaeota archaeon]|nr:hypothetical protein [Candidatus Woesearchaeota archaeon]